MLELLAWGSFTGRGEVLPHTGCLGLALVNVAWLEFSIGNVVEEATTCSCSWLQASLISHETVRVIWPAVF